MIARATETTRPRRVVLLGCGTIGSEVARRLLEEGPARGLELVRILVRAISKNRSLPRQLFTTNPDDVLNADADLAIELIGGLEPAAGLVARFLERGVPVVTANKTLIAYRGRELADLAARQQTHLAFEASVCAAIPILASLRQLEGDRILSISGIVNGSCNFILSRLADGLTFAAALAEARRRGLVEPDPSADLSGRDSAEKLCVLAAACGCAGVTPDRVDTEGIDRIGPEDVAAARKGGRAIKLLAELDLSGDSPRLRVGPTLIPRSHPLASVEQEDNALVIRTERSGELFLRGRGAGPAPTAAAVLGDVARLLGPSQRAAPARARLLHSAVPASAAGAPSRRHHLRILDTPDPAGLFDALRTHAVEPEEIAISRTAARLLTPRISTADAAACARTLAGHHPERVLVMPVLDAAN